MPSTLQRVMAAVIPRGDTLLICQRPADKRHGGLWEFPGGKCEPGETDGEAITRELAEELGVRVRTVGEEVYAANDPESLFLIIFVPVEIEGEPQCLDHSAIRWATLTELADLPLAPSDARFVHHLQQAQ